MKEKPFFVDFNRNQLERYAQQRYTISTDENAQILDLETIILSYQYIFSIKTSVQLDVIARM